tara:strand:- start:228 stop:410 length:183 start_codon:yes stop_codon:yes gene_type:complete
MAKKYKLKDKLMPRQPSFLGLDSNDWRLLNSGKVLKLDKLPKEAKIYLEEVESKEKKEVK